METHELFLSCRRGDLGRIEYLVEQKEVDLNIRDKWDSTPLYYACLCGHLDVVKYLLEKGGQCEANSFDGERCLYGALNNEIRNILRSYKAITSSTIRRDNYAEFLRRTLESGAYSDIVFEVHGHNFPAHRCILAARCEYFSNMFRNKWRDRSRIQLTHKLVYPHAFKAILQYLYTGRLDAHIDQLADIERLAKQCRLEKLQSQIEHRLKKIESFESTKPGVNVTTICIEPSITNKDLQCDLGKLADLALPPNFGTEGNLPFPPEELQMFPDVIFSVDGKQFHAHKVFFMGRSDYFRALMEDHFGENTHQNTQAGSLPVVTVQNISQDVFVQVMDYLYGDHCYQLTLQNVFEVLYAGDMYLLPGLKRQCAVVIGMYLETDNVMTILHTARMLALPRLEDQCAEFIATNIEKMVQRQEFRDFVVDDARSLDHREEADSIPIIDDIRFHITDFCQTVSDMYEADEKLAVIDELLEDLNLEG